MPPGQLLRRIRKPARARNKVDCEAQSNPQFGPCCLATRSIAINPLPRGVHITRRPQRCNPDDATENKGLKTNHGYDNRSYPSMTCTDV